MLYALQIRHIMVADDTFWPYNKPDEFTINQVRFLKLILNTLNFKRKPEIVNLKNL